MKIASICLISGKDNLSDAMTKLKTNHTLVNTLKKNKIITQVHLVFMVQTFPYINLDFIPTMFVPLNEDLSLHTKFD